MNQHTTSTRRGQLGVRLALISLGLTGVGIAATSGTSAAHTPNIAPSCDHLSITLVRYEGPESNNTVTVTIDGTPKTFNFAEEWTDSFPWTKSENHTWKVDIDANIATPGDTKYDVHEAGTQTACVTTTTEASTTTTVTPTTETPTTVTPPTETPTTVTSTTVTPTTVTSTTAPAAIVATTVTSTTVTPTAVATASEAVAVPATKTAVAAASGVAPKAGTLPATGSDTGVTLALAGAVLLIGLGMVTTTRRRRHS